MSKNEDKKRQPITLYFTAFDVCVCLCLSLGRFHSHQNHTKLRRSIQWTNFRVNHNANVFVCTVVVPVPLKIPCTRKNWRGQCLTYCMFKKVSKHSRTLFIPFTPLAYCFFCVFYYYSMTE